MTELIVVMLIIANKKREVAFVCVGSSRRDIVGMSSERVAGRAAG